MAQSSIPLLGATAVAVLAFGAIGLSQDSTGEFCRSLFQVVFLSLGLSWVTGVTVTPLLCVMFLKPVAQTAGNSEADAYGGIVFRLYRRFLLLAIRRRWATMAVVLVLFALSLWGFQYVDKSFFPDSTRPQFMVDVWLPQGTHINQTAGVAGEVGQFLTEMEGVTHTTALIGAGGLRFLVTYAPEKSNSAYIQFLVDVDDYNRIDGMLEKIEAELPLAVPEIKVFTRKFALRPGCWGKDPDAFQRSGSDGVAQAGRPDRGYPP